MQGGTVAKQLFLIDDISGASVLLEKNEHYRNAVSVLRQKNRLDAQHASYPSMLERFGDDLMCSSVEEMRTLVERAFRQSISKAFVDKLNNMGAHVGIHMTVEDIELGWLKEREMMSVGTVGNNRYMNVCIAQPHEGRQPCVYYICVQRKQATICVVLYEMCFSTNCLAGQGKKPYKTGLSAVLL